MSKVCRNCSKEYPSRGGMFSCSNGKRYTPDFYIHDDDLWIDVKGYTTDISREKMRLFQEMVNNLLIADASILKKQFGLDLRQNKLNERFSAQGVNINEF